MKTPLPDLLTVDEVADILVLHPRTVTRYCREGRLPYVELPSGRIRIHRSDLDALLIPRGSDLP